MPDAGALRERLIWLRDAQEQREDRDVLADAVNALLRADHLYEAVREIVDWPKSVDIDGPVEAIGRLTPNTSPPGDLYGPRITTARAILRDALARYEPEEVRNA